MNKPCNAQSANKTKKGPWSESEDVFLLTYIGVDPDYLATHDLGRAHGAGSNRAKKLADTGAAAAFARHRISYLHFLKLAGHLRSEFAEVAASDEMEQWHHFLGAEVRK